MKTYPDMNQKISGILRAGCDDTTPEGQARLYAAQLIDELQARVGELESAAKVWMVESRKINGGQWEVDLSAIPGSSKPRNSLFTPSSYGCLEFRPMRYALVPLPKPPKEEGTKS